MASISDIKIVGIDDERPPVVRKEKYIDLFFRLSQKAPLDWCEDFNKLGHQIEPGVKVNMNNSQVIETWIRDMELIPGHLEKIKEKIILCSDQYLEKVKQKNLAALAKSTSIQGMDGEQNKLNLIVASLDFEG